MAYDQRWLAAQQALRDKQNQLLMYILMQQMQGQQGQQQQGQPQGQAGAKDLAKTGKDTYSLLKDLGLIGSTAGAKPLYDAATQGAWNGPAMEAPANSIPSVSPVPSTGGFSSMNEMMGNGYNTPAISTDTQSAWNANADAASGIKSGSAAPSSNAQYLGGAQALGGIAQGYGGYKQFQNGEKLGGAANMAGGAFNTYAGGTAALNGGTASSIGQYAPVVGGAVAAAQVGQQMLNEKGNSEDRAAKSQAEAAKAAMLMVPVYGQIAYAALAGIDAVSGGQGTKQLTRGMKNIDKFNDRIDFGLGKNIRSKIFHQSTRGAAQEKTGQLLQRGEEDSWKNYVAGMREQYNHDPKDPTKPFAGKYATWDDYEKGGLEAADLTGVYGNMNVYGPGWEKLSQDQRQAITQENINSGLYKSKKGDVYITDRDVAKANMDKVLAQLKGPAPLAPGVTPQAVAAAATPMMIPRTGRKAPDYKPGPRK